MKIVCVYLIENLYVRFYLSQMNKIIEPLHVLEEAIRVLEGVEFKRQRVHVRVLGESPKFFAYYVISFIMMISQNFMLILQHYILILI